MDWFKDTKNWPELCVELDKDDLIGSVKSEISVKDLTADITKSLKKDDYRYVSTNTTDYEWRTRRTGIKYPSEYGYVPH